MVFKAGNLPFQVRDLPFNLLTAILHLPQFHRIQAFHLRRRRRSLRLVMIVRGNGRRRKIQIQQLRGGPKERSDLGGNSPKTQRVLQNGQDGRFV